MCNLIECRAVFLRQLTMNYCEVASLATWTDSLLNNGRSLLARYSMGRDATDLRAVVQSMRSLCECVMTRVHQRRSRQSLSLARSLVLSFDESNNRLPGAISHRTVRSSSRRHHCVLGTIDNTLQMSVFDLSFRPLHCESLFTVQQDGRHRSVRRRVVNKFSRDE